MLSELMSVKGIIEDHGGKPFSKWSVADAEPMISRMYKGIYHARLALREGKTPDPAIAQDARDIFALVMEDAS